MKKLNPHYYQTPPSGWVFTIPQSMSHKLGGTNVRGVNIDNLIDNVHNTFINNGEHFNMDEFEEALCKQLPDDSWCVNMEDNQHSFDPTTPNTLRKALEFYKVAQKWILGGAKFVSQDLAKRRYAHCMDCKFKTKDLDRASCISCKAEDVIRLWVRGKIKNLPELAESQEDVKNPYYCRLCGCELRVKAHFQTTPSCWKDL